MSEVEAPRPEAEAEAAAPSGFGRRLATERAKLGLSIDEIAARLRLHPKQVQAIESEALPALPAPFLRGFVRNYAKEVRLDPAPLVAELNALLGPQNGEPQQTTVRSTPAEPVSTREHGSRRFVLVGVLVALAILAVVGGLSTRGDNRQLASTTTNAKAGPAVATPAAAAVVEQKTQPVAPPPAEPVAPLAAATAAPKATSTPIAATNESLRLSFREQSWVEVTQADGRVLLSQVNERGTEQRIDGKAPMRLVIGNASAVSLDYKGKPIDLKSVTNADNVARITLN
jgi:cytoskeleton protein RodZ